MTMKPETRTFGGDVQDGDHLFYLEGTVRVEDYQTCRDTMTITLVERYADGERIIMQPANAADITPEILSAAIREMLDMLDYDLFQAELAWRHRPAEDY